MCYVFIVSREIQETLGFKNHKTCMREAALLDYYVCGFWWAKEASFSPTQTSFTMAVLHSLLDNIRGGEVTCQGVVFFIFLFFCSSQFLYSAPILIPDLEQHTHDLLL